MSISYLSWASSLGETAGLDGRDFTFALPLLLSPRRAAHEVLNPMPGETRGPEFSYEGTKTAKRLILFTQFRVNPQGCVDVRHHTECACERCVRIRVAFHFFSTALRRRSACSAVGVTGGVPDITEP